MALTRDQIVQRKTVATEVVPAPELGDGATLIVRRLSAREFMALTATAKAEADLAYAHWIAATVVDDQGNQVFTAEDDQGLVADLDITLVERLTDAAQRLNLSKRADDGPNPQPRSDTSATPLP
jgi:hypothetical protein